MVKDLLLFVIPVKTGIHVFAIDLDSRLRGNDNFKKMIVE
jgi:hypothetical protein